MIGGFLGAGKSTAIVGLARHLTDQGLKVGLISNDQGAGLVDTHLFQSHGFPVKEISGGCFCCKFDSLSAAADSLTEESKPDVFLAEPVGSCTDLVATVSYPLRRMYGDDVSIAPLSVLLDPERAARVLGMVDGRRLSDKVAYIYMKQIEEARIVVINKIDTLCQERLDALQAELRSRFPNKTIMQLSARNQIGIEDWYQELSKECDWLGEVLEIDYERYGEGEALLGWMNATVQIQLSSETDAVSFLSDWCESIRQQAIGSEVEIAHLKMTLSPQDGSGEVATVNLVRSDFVPEAAQNLMDPFTKAEVVVNLRCEAAPEWIEAAFLSSIGELTENDVQVELIHHEVFSPAPPQPVHRMSMDEVLS